MVIRPESERLKKSKYNNKNTNLSRISIGWSFERYSTTTDHRYCRSQLSGNFSNIPPSAIGLGNKCRKNY